MTALPRESLLREQDVAEWLGISSRTVRKLRQAGKLEYVAPTPGAIRYHPADVRAYIESVKQCASTNAKDRHIGGMPSQSMVADFVALRDAKRKKMPN